MKLSLEDKLYRDLLMAIARGTHRAGELLPAETTFAHERSISPNKVTAAYRRLEEDGVALDYGEHRIMLVAEASARARAALLRAAVEDLEHDGGDVTTALIAYDLETLQRREVLGKTRSHGPLSCVRFRRRPQSTGSPKTPR